MELSPVTTNDCSCFGASRLGINASDADFLYSEAAILPEICSSHCDCRLHAHIEDYEKRRERAYARNKLNIRANAPFPLLSKSSVQKGGRGVFSGAYGILTYELPG